MSDIDQAALLELMAGKNRANTLSAILSNMTDLKGAYEDALNAEGSALRENETHLESIQGRIDLFTNSLQTMWMNFISDDFVKMIVDAGTALIQLIDKVGVLQSALLAFAGIKGLLEIKGFAKKWDESFLQGFIDILSIFKNDISIIFKQSQSFGEGIEKILVLFNLSDTAFGKYITNLLATTATQAGATSSTLTFSAALGVLKTGLLNAGKSLISFLFSWKGLLVVAGIATVVGLAYTAINNSHKHLMEALKESSEEYAEEVSNLKSLQSELDATREKIEELETKGPLTLTEQEDLARLRNENDELERRLQIQERLAEYKRQEALKAFNKAFESDKDFEDYYVSGEGYATHYSTDPGSGVKVGTSIDQAIGNYNAAKQAEQDALQALHDTEAEVGTKEYNKLEKAYTNAQERVSAAETTLTNFQSDIQEYLDMEGVEWTDDPTTEAAKTANEYIQQLYNAFDQIEIARGTSGAKSDAIDRILIDQASESTKDFKEEIEKILEEDETVLAVKVDLDKALGDLDEAREQLRDVKQEAESLGVNTSKTVYGNIDTDNRAKLEWTKENLEKYKNALSSWFDPNMAWEDIVSEMENSYSTVFGSWDVFGEQQIPIAFSPMLQTADGAKLLDETTVYTYIGSIIERATQDGAWTIDEIIQLDAQGIDEVKGLIADVGETAERTSEAMHFTGETGAIADFANYVTTLESNISQLMSTVATKIQDVLNKYPMIKSALEGIGINTNDLAGYFLNTGEYAEGVTNKIATTTTTIDSLTASVEACRNALDIVNDIAFDGQAMSADYYEALKEQLKDITVDEEDFSDAIDTNNGYVVKNATLLKKLVAQAKNAKKATIQVAKAQAQLEYQELVQEISSNVAAMATEYDAYGLIADATLDNISTMREQLSVLKETIEEYALLELQLTDAASAYAAYEAAKERDEKLSYDESFLEMLKTIDQGLLMNETGTEAFEYAVKALVPKEYWDIDDPDKKVKSIHDYLDGNPVFAKLFHVDKKSGDLDINADNVREFVKMGMKNGVFSGDDSTGFSLSKKIEGVEDAAKAFGLTEAATLALFAALEKVDAKWGDVLTDLQFPPIEREVNSSVDALDSATQAADDYWRAVMAGDKEYDAKEYAKLKENIEAARLELQNAEQAANSNAKNWSLCQAAISSYRGELVFTQEEADALARSLGFLDDNGNPTLKVNDDGSLQLAEDQLTGVLEKIKELQEPSVMRVQLRYDEITAEINELQEYIDEGCKGKITIDGVEITNQDEAQKKIDELTPEKKQIEFTYGITETSSEQDKSILESYQEMAKNGVQFTVTANVQSAKEGVDAVSRAQDNIKEEQEITVIAYASTAEQAIKDVADQLDRIKSKTITLTIDKVDSEPHSSTTESGKNSALGNARAMGNVGLKSAEHGSIVGELGMETVVDPVKGIYYTVGENGTELVDLPRGAIIYNHKQTEELFTKGRTSRGHYSGGLSFASGNAYAGDYGIPSYHPNLKAETSFKNGTAINTTWDDAASTLSSAASKISDAADEFDETFDWIEVRLEEIEERLSLFSAAIENAAQAAEKNSIIDSMIELNKSKIENLKAGYQKYSDYAAELLTKIPEKYREAAQNGAIAIEEFVGEADETTLEAIQNYREWAQKAADVKQQAEETITEIRDLAIQKISNIHDAQSVRVDVENSQTEKLQNAIDYWETKGEIPSALYYGTNGGDAATSTGMFENSYKEIEYWSKALAGMQAELNEAVQKGQIEVGSIEWYEQIDQLYQVQSEIDQAKTEIEEFQNSINDLYWDNFDELISRLEYTENDTQNLIDVMSEADKVVKPEGKTLEGGTVKFWTADEVEWTKEGMASMGLYAQQMEIAEAKSKQYAKAIDDLTAEYEAGNYTENEYLEKLNELKDGQYDAIKSYQDAKDAIVDLNKERIDAVKEGIELEIDALSELIEKKKEELSADKDLYDFHKATMSQSKEIADIQRKLAAMAGDNSASAMAQKRQLEAELAEAQAELQDSYLDRSVENQQTALDKELEDFKTEKEAEIAALDEWLTNVEAVITESLGVVQANAEQIGQTLTDKAEEYNLTVSDAVMLPWKDGMLAISDYTTKFGDSVSSTTDQLDLLKAKWQEVIDKMNEAAATDIAAKEQENKKYTAATKQEPVVKEEPKEEPKTETQAKTIAVGGKINAKGAKIYSYAGGKGYNQYYNSDPIYTVLATKGDWIQVRHHKLKSGVTGWFKKGSVQAYASGTTALKKSGLVNIDELGEELILRAENGRLSYMEKGSGIVPADLTSNLMKWGELDPTSMLENNRPSIGVHPEIHNTEINLNITYGDMVSIGEFHGDNPEDIAKIVAKQFEKHTKDLNNAIRKFVR